MEMTFDTVLPIFFSFGYSENISKVVGKIATHEKDYQKGSTFSLQFA